MTLSPESQEQLLALRFRQLRDAESQTAPPLPELPAVAAHPQPGNSLAKRGTAAVATALAASVLVMIALPERQSPQALYLDIMQSSVLMTDELLQTSDSTLPEMREIQAFDFAPAAGPLSEFN